MDDHTIARLPLHQTTQTQDRHRQMSMLQVGLEPTIPLFEWAKTSHALDHVATNYTVSVHKI
jgi:hypothetical protein